jgi:hypothetical protein
MACGCNEICNCVVQGGPGVTVGGTGSPGDPYVINVGSAESTSLTVTDTNSVDLTLTGTGTALDPFDIEAAVIRDPEPNNLLAIGPNGLDVPCEAVQDCVGQGFTDGLQYDDAANQFKVRLSTDPGNITTLGTDDGVFTPSAPVTLGCGLELGGSGEIQVNVQDFGTLTRRNCDDDSDEPGTTPLPGPDTAGQAVYCGADGNLRTMPEKFTETGIAGIDEAHVPAVTELPFTTGAIQLSVTNPSNQYCMCGYVTFALIAAVSGAPGTVIQINHELDMGDGIFIPATAYTLDNRGKNAIAGSGNFRMALPIPVCLDPGEVKVIRHRVTYLRESGDNGGAVTITATAREIYFVGTNL